MLKESSLGSEMRVCIEKSCSMKRMIASARVVGRFVVLVMVQFMLVLLQRVTSVWLANLTLSYSTSYLARISLDLTKLCSNFLRYKQI